jgi:hypothetical protein
MVGECSRSFHVPIRRKRGLHRTSGVVFLCVVNAILHARHYGLVWLGARPFLLLDI